MVVTTARASLLLLGTSLVAAGPGSAQVASYQAGTAGQPAVAPDPLTQGWFLNEGGAGNTVLTPVSPDGATGLNAWRVEDGFANGGSRADYRYHFTSSELALVGTHAWEFSADMRLLHSTAPDIVLDFATGQASQDERHLLFLEVAGGDVLVTNPGPGLSFFCPGAMDGGYHSYAIRKSADSQGGVTEFLFDGVVLGSMPASSSNGNAPAGGVSWGTGSSAGTGAALFNTVEFTVGPPLDMQMADIFVSGAEYPSFRIPAILSTSAGSVLAFAEGRSSASDHAKNDIVMRRSADGGYTWGSLVVLADDGDNSLNNPCVLQVDEGLHAGRILLLYQRYPFGCHESCVEPGYTGRNTCRCFLMYSDDDGVTWSTPTEITQQVKRPSVATSIAGGPGVGIQKRYEPHKGRLIVPFNQGGSGWDVYAVYSDDGGDSWAYGALADDSQTAGMGNEVQMVELVDGSLLLNARSMSGTHHRKIAHSYDGGLTWTPLMDDLGLIEPQCMASVLRHTDPLDGYLTPRLLYAGPNSSSSRVDGTIHISYDEGQSWSVSKLLYAGSYAYSVLTILPDGSIGCLFERNGYSKITMARCSLEWLTDSQDCPGAGTSTYCTASTNSLGVAASIGSAGSVVISRDDFQLSVDLARPLGFGLFFYSDEPTSLPFGDGVMCVGPGSFGHVRTPVLQLDISGAASMQFDYDAQSGPAAIKAGGSYYFQFWYRDLGGPGGSGFNTSDALEASFCP